MGGTGFLVCEAIREKKEKDMTLYLRLEEPGNERHISLLIFQPFITRGSMAVHSSNRSLLRETDQMLISFGT